MNWKVTNKLKANIQYKHKPLNQSAENNTTTQMMAKVG